MGNHHSDHEHQGKGNPEGSPKPKKENDIWSNFRNRTKASASPTTQASTFRPVPPNLFKGVPDFTATTAPVGKAQSPPVGKTQSPPGGKTQSPPVRAIPAQESHLNPASAEFTPMGLDSPNLLWGPKEPSAYDITWERPGINSPMPPSIPSFGFPPVDTFQMQSEVSHTTTSAAATVATPSGKWSTPRPKTPPKVPKEAWPKPLPPVKSVVPREPGPILPQPPRPTTSPTPVIQMAANPLQPLRHADENFDEVQVCQQSPTPTAERKTVAFDQSAKSPSNQEGNTAAQDKDSKDGAKAQKQSYVDCEQTQEQIRSRISYLENQSEVDVQNQAVVRKALKGASYAESLKKSQPKVNPARREAKEKSSKKAKASKSAKQEQTKTAASPAERGSSDLPEPANSSSTSNILLRETPDMGATHTRNVKATPQQVEAHPLNEQPASAPVNIRQDARQSTNVNSAISKIDLVDHSQTQKSFSMSGKSPSVTGKTHSSSCQAVNVNTSQSMAVPNKSHVERQGSPLQVNSDPGPTEEPAAMDTTGNTIPHEPPKLPPPPRKSGKPTFNPDAPCFTPIMKKQTTYQRTLSGELVPPIALPQGPPSVSAVPPPSPENDTPAQTSDRKMKPLNNPAPQPINTKASDVSEANGAQENTEEKVAVQPDPPSSPQPPPRPEGRWHPFTTDRTCVQKVHCQHRQNGSLPKNVLQWQNVSRNHLCEPSWVTTASLAASIALSARLDREDSRQ